MSKEHAAAILHEKHKVLSGMEIRLLHVAAEGETPESAEEQKRLVLLATEFAFLRP